MPLGDLDGHGLPMARARASAAEILRNRRAVVDHLSVAQCAGFAGSSFTEVRFVWSDLQVPWAGAYGDAAEAVVAALDTPLPGDMRGELDLERAIKWFLLLPALPLRLRRSTLR